MRKPIAAMMMSTFLSPMCSQAAQTWGGSLGFTSDYLVRGISRSDHDPALQADLHTASDFGLIGGVYASSVRISAQESRTAELSAFIGFAWRGGDSWRAKGIVSHYTYPWTVHGSHYDYDELDVDVAYGPWFDLSAVYSPNSPRYQSDAGFLRSAQKSAEIDFQSPWRHRLAGTAGVGYSQFSGIEGAGYAYWSVGALYDLAPWTISASYAGTGAAARYLFYNAAVRGRWMATVIWRF